MELPIQSTVCNTECQYWRCRPASRYSLSFLFYTANHRTPPIATAKSINYIACFSTTHWYYSPTPQSFSRCIVNENSHGVRLCGKRFCMHGQKENVLPGLLYCIHSHSRLGYYMPEAYTHIYATYSWMNSIYCVPYTTHTIVKNILYKCIQWPVSMYIQLVHYHVYSREETFFQSITFTFIGIT